MGSRKIIHIDMDCFYAAVETKFQPHLKGKPVAVGAISIDGTPGGRGGVLTTANYEARQFGVKSAMPSARALRLCPDLILIPPDFQKYRAESRKVRAILERYSQKIEPLSLDEAYLDVTDSPFENGSATRIAARIRREIQEETGLTASAGVAPNKFLAKIASDLKKPDGLSVIRPEQVEAFVRALPVEKIWGVGKVTARKMHSLGIRTCLDLQRYSVAQLTELFGSWGTQLYDFARGVDSREVSTDRERKSLTVEWTYSKDFTNRQEIIKALEPLYADFVERLAAYRARGEDEREQLSRSIVIKLKFSDFRQKGRERKWESLETPKLEAFQELVEAALDGETLGVRLIGLGVRLASNRVRGREEGAGAEARQGLQLSFR
ncbi:MAG: DNA polymerase IV [Bdellovibrionales bacterium]|nr:DNA polymerase IV [Bdellovibrionales bacterium]